MKQILLLSALTLFLNIETFAADKKEEKNYKINLSGFTLVEYEYSRNFGYEPTVTDFDKFDANHKRSHISLLSNIHMDIESEKTALKTITEIGEVYLGDDGTGGKAAEEDEIVQIRNLYLDHKFSEDTKFSAGLFLLTSDPRGFLLWDDFGAVQVQTKLGNFNTKIYHAISSDNAPSEDSQEEQKYTGALVDTEINSITPSLYLLHSTEKNTTDGGKYEYWWLGATVSGKFSALTAEASYIYNKKDFSGFDQTTETDSNASLADLKVSYDLDYKDSVISVEALHTSGSTTAATDDDSFKSPVSYIYLLNIATSDGWMEYPGSAKESVVGDLGQTTGLRVYVLSFNTQCNEKTSAYVKYGLVKSKEEQNGSTNMGYEIDLGSHYQIDDQTKLMLDLGYFNPGKYYTKTDIATLASLGLRYDF